MSLQHNHYAFDNFFAFRIDYFGNILFGRKYMEKTLIEFAKAKSRYAKTIGDQEINALFQGLVKIVKRYAITQVQEELKRECDMATENFRTTIVDLGIAEERLKKQIERNSYLENIVATQQKKITDLLKKLARK